MPDNKSISHATLSLSESAGRQRRNYARRPVTPREELLLIWDLICPAGRADIVAAARHAATEAGLVPPSAPLACDVRHIRQDHRSGQRAAERGASSGALKPRNARLPSPVQR
jgi:hypothetical protein